MSSTDEVFTIHFLTTFCAAVLNFLKNGGKMIFHLPSFHIIDKHNYKNFLNRDFKDFAFEI